MVRIIHRMNKNKITLSCLLGLFLFAAHFRAALDAVMACN